VIIVADHGNRLPSAQYKRDDFKIPMLFLGGALKHTGLVHSKTGSQIDLPATLLSQLGLEYKDFSWSKNLLDSSSTSWAYFAFNNGFGYAEPAGTFVYDNTGNMVIENHGTVSPKQIKRGRFVQQLTFQDYLDR
jgi:membrane-anchored protein YejM (alkaline phosphatase superfamily)